MSTPLFSHPLAEFLLQTGVLLLEGVGEAEDFLIQKCS